MFGLDHADELLAEFRMRPEHAAVGVHPDARAFFLGELDHVHHVRMQHRLAAARASQPRAVRSGFRRDLLPQLDRKQVALALVVELANLGVAVGVGAIGAAVVAGVDDRDDDHQRKFFRALPQSVFLVLVLQCRHWLPIYCD